MAYVLKLLQYDNETYFIIEALKLGITKIIYDVIVYV